MGDTKGIASSVLPPRNDSTKRNTMSDVTIYHNPRCNTSRTTLELIKKKGIEPKVIEYLKTPPTAMELDHILKLLSMEPRQIIRTKEPEYAKLKLNDPKLTRAE